MTNTLSPVLSPLDPPEAEDVPAAVEVPAADEVAAEDVAAALLEDELPDEPQAAMLTAAVVARRARPEERKRRVREGCASTSCIRRLLCWA
jgi:hypothetical protein